MTETSKKKGIAIGREDFKEMIDKQAYFVDKTLMIKDIIDSQSKVTLFTRPRRFGKTLNLSMLRRFLEDERKADGSPVDNRHLFDGLAISQCGEDVLRHQQQYPVIIISLKSAKQRNYEMAYKCLTDEIAKEFERHRYVLQTDTISTANKIRFEQIAARKAEASEFAKAFSLLSECLSVYHGMNTIILIDEYDVPLENAYFTGFYDEMIGFIRSLFESGLKTNPYLERGIITGCLRISRESIFTGLNNLKMDSVLHTSFGSSFGFTEDEVKSILEYYGLQECFPEVQSWYDGYICGGEEIYTPGSTLNYVEDHDKKITRYPLPYWSNTSSNSIVRNLVRNADKKTRDEIELLIAGKTIEKPVHEDITYGDMDSTQDNLWNFLYFTGNLKAVSQSFRNDQLYLNLQIPNRELKSIYRNTVQDWFRDSIAGNDFSSLRTSLEAGDCVTIGEYLSEKLMATISYYDYDESYYHGFLAGILNGMGGYDVLSNRESGEGRPDIVLKEQKFWGRAMILELKVTDNIHRMEEQCRAALEQIETRNYAEELESDGYEPILKYGICFYKKGCKVSK